MPGSLQPPRLSERTIAQILSMLEHDVSSTIEVTRDDVAFLVVLKYRADVAPGLKVTLDYAIDTYIDAARQIGATVNRSTAETRVETLARSGGLVRLGELHRGNARYDFGAIGLAIVSHFSSSSEWLDSGEARIDTVLRQILIGMERSQTLLDAGQYPPALNMLDLVIGSYIPYIAMTRTKFSRATAVKREEIVALIKQRGSMLDHAAELIRSTTGHIDGLSRAIMTLIPSIQASLQSMYASGRRDRAFMAALDEINAYVIGCLEWVREFQRVWLDFQRRTLEHIEGLIRIDPHQTLRNGARNLLQGFTDSSVAPTWGLTLRQKPRTLSLRAIVRGAPAAPQVFILKPIRQTDSAPTALQSALLQVSREIAARVRMGESLRLTEIVAPYAHLGSGFSTFIGQVTTMIDALGDRGPARLRIPMKAAGDSDMKPVQRSDLKAVHGSDAMPAIA